MQTFARSIEPAEGRMSMVESRARRSAIGARVAAARVIIGLSQRELGDRIGQSALWVRRLEAGAVDPTMRRFIAVCAALGCSPSDLLA